MVSGHVTVLLEEAVIALDPQPGGTYVDATFGGGGHSALILERMQGRGRLIAIDADPAASQRAEQLRSAPGGDALTFVQANFRDLRKIAESQDATRVDGVLMDLGLSSFQLDEAERGFALRLDGPLDMRFDPTRGVSAADIVNTWSPDDIASVLWRYGEEKRSRQIARTIADRRARQPITTTADLAGLIAGVVGRGKSALHPATRSFQALRIAVNEELTALEQGLAAAVEILRPGGRMAVISFHSLEDRMVKQFMALESATCICPPGQPVCTCGHKARLRRIGKPMRPSDKEMADNSRSRSAIMRVAERLGTEAEQ